MIAIATVDIYRVSKHVLGVETLPRLWISIIDIINYKVLFDSRMFTLHLGQLQLLVVLLHPIIRNDTTLFKYCLRGYNRLKVSKIGSRERGLFVGPLYCNYCYRACLNSVGTYPPGC